MLVVTNGFYLENSTDRHRIQPLSEWEAAESSKIKETKPQVTFEVCYNRLLTFSQVAIAGYLQPKNDNNVIYVNLSVYLPDTSRKSYSVIRHSPIKPKNVVQTEDLGAKKVSGNQKLELL